MWKHIGKNPEYVMVGEPEEKNKDRGKQSTREPIVRSPLVNHRPELYFIKIW